MRFEHVVRARRSCTGYRLVYFSSFSCNEQSSHVMTPVEKTHPCTRTIKRETTRR